MATPRQRYAARKRAGRSVAAAWRRKKARRGRRRVPLPITGFTKQKVVKLRYVFEFTLVNTGTGTNPIPSPPTSVAESFSANGPYQPYTNGATHQPKGFDQWMNIYNHYNVLGSKARVKCTFADSNMCWGVTRVPAPGVMAGKNISQVLETRFQKGTGVINVYFNQGQVVRANKTQSATFSQKKQFGMNSTNNDELTGNIERNPEEETYYDIWQCPGLIGQGATTGKVCTYLLTIDYIVLFTEPKLLGQS